MRNQRFSKKGQVWIETVIYTLIGLVIIGAVLVIAKPKIEEYKDKIVIEQTIDSMNKINGQILEAWQKGTGNTRTPAIRIKRGKLIIDAEEDMIRFIIEDSKTPISQPTKQGEEKRKISIGDINVSTEESGRNYVVELELNYQGKIELLYEEKNEEKVFQKAASEYLLSIENQGYDDVIGLSKINIKEIS